MKNYKRRIQALASMPALTDKKHKRWMGMTLVEILMVIAVGGMLIAAGLALYQRADSGRKTDNALTELGVTQQAIRTLYSGQSNYNGLDAELLSSSNILPQRMVRSASPWLSNAFNGDIVIATQNSDSEFSISYTGVPKDACSSLAVIDLGSALVELTVNAGAAHTVFPVDVGTVTAECSGGFNEITWAFK